MLNKFFKMFVTLSVLGVVAFGVGCKDYGGDIDDLKSQVAQLKTTVDKLQADVNSGALITSVTSDNQGGVIITTTNGTYHIEAGKDGKDGKDGANGSNGSSTPSTVWSIGDDGYWYEDGVKTEHKAVATDGEKGDKGEDGSYWKVETKDGGLYFVEYKNGAKTGNEEKINLPSGSADGVTAIWDTEAYELTLIVDGEPVVVYLASTLKSLAFVPETIFDGLGVIEVKKFTYPGYTTTTPKTYPFVKVSTEDNTGLFLTTAPTIATYRLNPQNVNPEDYTFDFINRTAYTRATADASDLVEFVSGKMDKGLYDVTIKLNKDLTNDTPDHQQYNDIVALRAIANDKKGDLNEYIVSDYSYLESTLYWGYRIIHQDKYKKGEPRFYRYESFVDIEEETDYNGGAGITVDGFLNPATVVLNYKDQVDLLDYVYTYCATYGDVVDELLGVEYEFYFAGLDANQLVTLSTDGTQALYESNTGELTNQNAFVVLTGDKGSVIKVNDQFIVNGTPAIGRTPLVYVRSLVDGKPLAEAFIKIEIIEGEVAPEPTNHWWDIFIIHDVNFDYDKLTTTATAIGENGTVTAPRKPAGPNPNNKLIVNWTEVNQWVLDDNEVNMSYENFGKKYNLDEPKIVVIKNGTTYTQPGETLPDYGDASIYLDDFSNIGTYYQGVSGTKLSPTNWEQSTNIVDILLDNTVAADGVKHYIYVVFESLTDQYPDVVLEFIYFIPKHEHEFTLLEWILNPDYVLNANPNKPWLLNPTRPSNVNAAADRTQYGVVRVKGQENVNQSGLIEHFKEYSVEVNLESTYTFEIVNYLATDVEFQVTGTTGVVATTTAGYSTVTLTGAELEAIVNQTADTPYIVLSGASRLQESKEILVKVTEVCNGDAAQKKDGYYYVVFEALKATINFNDIAFGTYKDYSDYALVYELIKSVVDENGESVLEWDGSAWKLVGAYSDMTTATIAVTLDALTYTYGDSEASFGERLYPVESGQTPAAGYDTGVTFDADGIEWWNMGTDLQVDKHFGAKVTITITVDGTKIKLAEGEGEFTVLSTANTAAQKDPNHEADGTYVPDPWK